MVENNTRENELRQALLNEKVVYHNQSTPGSDDRLIGEMSAEECQRYLISIQEMQEALRKHNGGYTLKDDDPVLQIITINNAFIARQIAVQKILKEGLGQLLNNWSADHLATLRKEFEGLQTALSGASADSIEKTARDFSTKFHETTSRLERSLAQLQTVVLIGSLTMTAAFIGMFLKQM